MSSAGRIIFMAVLPMMLLSDEVIVSKIYMVNKKKMVDYKLINNDDKYCTLTYGLVSKNLFKTDCVSAMGRRGADLYCISEKEDTCRSSYEMKLLVQNEHE